VYMSFNHQSTALAILLIVTLARSPAGQLHSKAEKSRRYRVKYFITNYHPFSAQLVLE
jgi:hypothetical protein